MPAYDIQDADLQGMSSSQLIVLYRQRGYSMREILGVMVIRQGKITSERSSVRVLRRYRLTRGQSKHSLEEIIQGILLELSASGENAGYRQMRQRLLINHGLAATFEMVRLILGLIDPQGVALRQAGRLRRRIYINNGPNIAIHLDGWDKLNPYGLSIHGAVDGFSRRVLWLKSCDSNKKPMYISSFYLDYIREINGIPVRVYGDRGTENSIVRDVQMALRWTDADQYQGILSFVYVSSNRNVRIERFWRSLREMCGNVWMNHFKDMSDFGLLDTSDSVHLECIRYCFLPVISKDLNEVCNIWNTHRVRRNNRISCPAGKPEVLFFQPEVYGARDCKIPLVDNRELNDVVREYSQRPPELGVSQEFLTIAKQLSEI